MNISGNLRRDVYNGIKAMTEQCDTCGALVQPQDLYASEDTDDTTCIICD